MCGRLTEATHMVKRGHNTSIILRATDFPEMKYVLHKLWNGRKFHLNVSLWLGRRSIMDILTDGVWSTPICSYPTTWSRRDIRCVWKSYQAIKNFPCRFWNRIRRCDLGDILGLSVPFPVCNSHRNKMGKEKSPVTKVCASYKEFFFF